MTLPLLRLRSAPGEAPETEVPPPRRRWLRTQRPQRSQRPRSP